MQMKLSMSHVLAAELLLFVTLCSGLVPCTELNVLSKYSACFRPESRILYGTKHRSESYCLEEYQKVADCIENLGKNCDNGEKANYMRFLYHEYNIVVAGEYACKYLEELRHVVRCVSKYSRNILYCRRSIWYGKKMAPFLRKGTTQQVYCWNMGVTVHCRQIYARLCTHNMHYFNYLFSVYPIECQNLPWSNGQAPPKTDTVINIKDCSIHNFINLFYKCFSIEVEITDKSVNSESTCRNKFAKMRACTNNLYKSCSKVSSLAQVTKNYASPIKMNIMEDYVCKNLKNVQKGAKCINQYKNLIKGCAEAKQKFELPQIRYMQTTNPEKAACLVITTDYRCRLTFKYLCPDADDYFKYLSLMNPTCAPSVGPSTGAEKCSLSSISDLYRKCFLLQDQLIITIDVHDNKNKCMTKFYPLSKCLKQLEDSCRSTKAAYIAKQLNDPKALVNGAIKFACDNIKVLQRPAFCLLVFKKEVNKCITSGEKLKKNFCQYMTFTSRCQYDTLVRHKCTKAESYLEYVQFLVKESCSVTKPVADKKVDCGSDEYFKTLQNCVKNEIDTVSNVRLSKKQCGAALTASWECYLSVSRNCSSDQVESVRTVFSRKSLDKLISYTCPKLKLLQKYATCVKVKRSASFDDDCYKSVTIPKSVMFAGDKSKRKNYLCQTVTRVTKCHQKQKAISDCDSKNATYAGFLEHVIPLTCKGVAVGVAGRGKGVAGRVTASGYFTIQLSMLPIVMYYTGHRAMAWFM